MEGRKVGDLARASGLTVRALHHYEDVGLLQPSRSDAGHRVYGEDDVERLFMVIQLRRLGLSLGEIRRTLDDVDAHFRHVASHGGDIVYEPVDQPYGYREYGARDHEGGLWSFMEAIDDPPPASEEIT